MKPLLFLIFGAAQSVAASETTIVVATQPLASHSEKHAPALRIERPEAVHAMRATRSAKGGLSYSCDAPGLDFRFTKPLRPKEY